MYALVNEKNKVEVFAQEDDICYECTNADVCPLILAIHAEVVVLRYESVNVDDCTHFKSVNDSFDFLS